MTIKVTSNEIVDLLFGDLMKILEPELIELVTPYCLRREDRTQEDVLMHSTEFSNVQSIRKNSIYDVTPKSIPSYNAKSKGSN